MASILDISDLDNFIAELNHPEHAALPNIEFDNDEENLCRDQLEVLGSLASPVSPLNLFGCTNWDSDDISCYIDRNIMEGEQGAPDELTSLVGQNMSDLGYINFDTDTPSSNICWNVGVDITEAEQAGPCEITSQVGQNLSDLGCVNCDSGSSSSNIICNVDVESMQAEQAALSELTSQVSQSVDGLRCINFDSDTLSCNISWNFGQDIIQSERAASDELTSQVGLDLTDVLRTKLHHSMENQCKFDASLIEMEQQFQQEFDQIPAAHKKILWENTKIGTVGADTTTAISRSLQELSHRRLQYDERSFIQVISSDDGEPQARHHPEQPMHLVSLTSPPKKQIRLDWTGREGTNEVYTSESDAHTRKVLHCNQRNNSMESWADVALDVGQMGKVLLHGSTTARVESPEQSEDASQAQLIGKSIEIPHKNASKRRLNESTSYHCAECGKQFSTKDYLAIHLRIHAGEKPYKCRQCDYACVAASTLYRHERTHTAAKPFKCLICDAAFKFRSYLTRHQLTHNGARPFKCLTCTAAFRFKGNLDRHQKIHSGEKPYECNVCNQTFLHYSTLSTHRKGHKKEESCRYESNVGGDIMEQEQATLGDLTSQVGRNLDGLGYINDDSNTSRHSNSSSNFDKDMMEAEEAEPVELTSQIGQNLDGLGYINDDFDTSGHGLSNSHISQKFDGDVMVAEQAAPEELTSHIGQNWDGLGYINYDAGSPSNINRNVDGDVMIAEQAASGELTSQAGNNIGSNIDGDVMQAEEVELINNISWNVGGEVVQGTQSQLNSQLENLNTLGYTNCDIYTSINGIIQNIIDVDAVQAEQYVLTEPSVQYIVVYSHTLGKTCW